MNEFLERAARGKNAWWRYVLSLIAACIVGTTLFVAATIALNFAHLLPANFPQLLGNPTDAPVFYLGTGAVFGALVVGLIASMQLFQGKRPSDVIGRWRWKLFFSGVAIWAAVECFGTGIDYILAPKGFSISASASTASLALVALVGLSVQTFAEEFVFRGYLTQGLLLAFKRPVPTAIVSGVLFGSLHIPNGWPAAVNAVVFGIVCAFIAMRTGGIAFTYGLHIVNNLFGAVAVVSTNDVFRGSPGLMTQNTPGLMWWDTWVSLVALGIIGVLVLRSSAFAPKAIAT